MNRKLLWKVVRSVMMTILVLALAFFALDVPERIESYLRDAKMSPYARTIEERYPVDVYYIEVTDTGFLVYGVDTNELSREDAEDFEFLIKHLSREILDDYPDIEFVVFFRVETRGDLDTNQVKHCIMLQATYPRSLIESSDGSIIWKEYRGFRFRTYDCLELRPEKTIWRGRGVP